MLLLEIKKQLVEVIPMFDEYEVTGKQERDDSGLKAAALECRLYAYGVWCGLFIFRGRVP